MILRFLLAKISITGKRVKEPRPEPNMLIATSKPKFCNGTN